MMTVIAVSLIAFGVFFPTYRFNHKTYVLVRAIQKLVREQGEQWDFYGNQDRLFTFLISPSSLISPDDSPAILVAKQALVAHRQSLKKYILAGAAMLLTLPLVLLIAAIVSSSGH
jgi:hypothetical protein